MAPTTLASHDFRVVVGNGGTSCTQPYSASAFKISAMSFGSLSANAMLALNGGAERRGFAHDTGEGSINQHHRVHGGGLVWEVGPGCIGCRSDDGRFDPGKIAAAARDRQVMTTEPEPSQGATPGHGGELPEPTISA
jgi:glutamate synthase domain-containing protein 2